MDRQTNVILRGNTSICQITISTENVDQELSFDRTLLFVYSLELIYFFFNIYVCTELGPENLGKQILMQMQLDLVQW